MEPYTTDKPSAARRNNGSGRSRIGIYLANGLIVFFLVCFGLGLASQSPAAYMQAPPASFVLGKSPRLWGTTLLSATLCLLVIFGRVRRVEFLRSVGKLSGRVLLTLAITVTLYEAAGFTFARWLPITLLQNLPDWVHDVLPESAFERVGFSEPNIRVAEQEMGWAIVSNLMVIQIRPGAPPARKITDSNGFPNMDESLYARADILTFGDSFTTADGVDFQFSWPQQLAALSGKRILNLARDGTYPYHFLRFAKRYGTQASQQIMIVGFGNRDSGEFYDYLDYIKLHPDIKGFDQYRREIKNLQTFQVWQYPDPHYPNWLSVVSRNMLVPVSWVVPFSAATLEYMVQFSDREPPGPVAFSLGGKQITMDYYNPVVGIATTHSERLQQDFAASIPLYSNCYRFAKRRKFRSHASHACRQYMDFQAIIDLARDHHIKLYLVYLPSAGEVYFPLLRDATNLNARAQMVASENNSTHIRPSEAYVSLLAMASLCRTPLYDATPYLQTKARAGEQLNLEFDPHPSPLGHLRIAEFVQSIMTDKGAKEALRNNRRP